MRWIISLMLVLAMVTSAMAGEDPYIAIVGNDINAAGFYVSSNYKQFMYDQEAWSVPVCDGTFPGAYNVYGHPVYGPGCEQFRSQTPVIQPEICDINGYAEGVNYFSDYGRPNALIRMGDSGWYEWYVRLPKTPSGQINLVLQCGILKPGAFAFLQYDAITLCAAETGERVGPGFCARKEVNPGFNPLVISALPKITAIAYPGPYNSFPPFNLTAFRNPGSYNPFSFERLANGEAGQVLNGSSAGTRILLKACMDKTVVVKLPVTGQVNAEGQVENDLLAGDILYVRLDIPRANTVDVYCHEQSLKVMGIGEAPF